MIRDKLNHRIFNDKRGIVGKLVDEDGTRMCEKAKEESSAYIYKVLNVY